MRWDFHRYLRLDLNDWLRGRRDWRDFWELKDELPALSKYRKAILCDPDVVEKLAAQPESDGVTPPSVDEWEDRDGDWLAIKNLLVQILYATAHASPSDAPQFPMPEFPHLVRRRELKFESDVSLLIQLVPHEFEEVDVDG